MSLRLKFLNIFLKIAVKPRLRHLKDPTKARQDLERAARWVFPSVPMTLTLPIKLRVSLGKEVSALSIRNRPTLMATKPGKPRPIILYIHGGGYLAGSPRTHEKMLARLSRLTNLEVIAPWYRLAPEHPFPAAFNDIYTAFEALLQKGHQATDIVIGGDSAGGGLAFSLMAKLCAEGTPPRALFAFSPLTDMRFMGDSFVYNAKSDPLLPMEKQGLVTRMYLAGNSPEDPRASPLLADFPTPPPPVFLQFSKTEILRDDSLRMADKLRKIGGQVDLDIWENPPHVWVLFDGLLPESRIGLNHVANFIKSI